MMLLTRFMPMALLLATAAPSSATEDWHRNLEDGLAAARKSGKPVLVATSWTDGQ